MEETLALQSERDFLKAVEENSQFLLTTFTQRHRRFDGERLTQKLIRLFVVFDGNIMWFKSILLEVTVGSFEGKKGHKLNCASPRLTLLISRVSGVE